MVDVLLDVGQVALLIIVDEALDACAGRSRVAVLGRLRILAPVHGD